MKYLALLLLISSFAEARQLKVAIVDTGIDLHNVTFVSHMCPTGHLDLTGYGIQDTHNHGSNVASIIINNAKDSDYCIVVVKYYLDSNSGSVNLTNVIRAFKYLNGEKIDVINYSGGGPEFSEKEYLEIKKSKAMFIVAAGNEHQDLDSPENNYYPASINLPNIISVGSMDYIGKVAKFSNYGAKVKKWELGEGVKATCIGGNTCYVNGTSFSTAIHTGKYIYEKSH